VLMPDSKLRSQASLAAGLELCNLRFPALWHALILALCVLRPPLPMGPRDPQTGFTQG